VSTSVGDLIDAPLGNRYLIPWQWLTSNSKKTMEIVFQFAFDEDQDFSRGFAIHHLKFIDLVDVKAIRYLDYRYVQLAIEEIQRLVLNKKYPELPTIDDSDKLKRDFQVNEFEIYDELIRKASNIEDLADAILERLDAEFPMSERDKAVVSLRAAWFTSKAQTLESIGKDYGLTRERIRQITKKYENPNLRFHGELRFARLLSEAARSSNSLDDLQVNVANQLLTRDEYLDIDQCKAMMELLSDSTGWSVFETKLVIWETEAQVNEDAAGVISKFRSKMGFIDVIYAAKELDLTFEKTLEVIIDKYPRSIVSNSLVLARTEKLVSTFESMIGKQLLVTPALPAQELLLGARRHAALRNDSMSGIEIDYVAIIHRLCGNPPTSDFFIQTQLYSNELSESDNWLIGIFNTSANGLLHRVEITKLAIESGMNLGSITAYCASNPFIRSHTSGVYSLIGKKPNPWEVSIHAELALSQDGAVDLQLEFQGSNVLVTLKPNLNTYASAVILPSREIREIFTEAVFIPECKCGPIISRQVIKLSKDGFWTGFPNGFRQS
jgi:hypothetical protein